MGSVGIEKMEMRMEQIHVLAVDDSLVDRKVIERLLKISCCKVTAVESGTRALEFLGLDGEKGAVDFQELKVNLIMTDYSMPGMTGYELLKKIKGSSACKEIPVVIMSSENIMTRIDRCLEEGAEDFLMKPVKLSDVERLRDCIMKGEDKDSEKQLSASPQPPAVSVSSSSKPTSLISSAPSSTPTLATLPNPQTSLSLTLGSMSSPTSAPSLPSTPLVPSLPQLFASDLSCSLQHLSSPPSSPHWPSKRPRLLNGDQ